MTDTAIPALMLHNSLTRQLEPFRPVEAGQAKVYTCGPTVYNYQHIGNMRAFLFADTLGRTLRFKGYDLTHIINITDVGHLTSDADAGDDKMEKAAASSGQSIWDIARHYTEAFWHDIKRLNITEPAKWSVATDHIDEMLDFAKEIAPKHCYELDSGLYFDTSSVPDYGALARVATEDGESRIAPVDGKKQQSDFAIWRKSSPEENRQMEWDSPWGKGAPGWHLECSVMSMKYLGQQFDIHTGGIDHREIHHPNEIAQNQAKTCSGHSGANIWMHNNFLVDRGGKMSKSAGEFLVLETLVKRGIHPLAYRLMCLQAHYRSELEFTWDNLSAALTRLKRMAAAMEKLRDKAGYSENTDIPSLPEHPHPKISQALATFDAAISDDLNTAKALTILDDILGQKRVDAVQRLALIACFDTVLGLDLLALSRIALRITPAEAAITPEDIEAKLVERKAARADKDFARSDVLRDELVAAGVEVMDGDPLGWEWAIAY